MTEDMCAMDDLYFASWMYAIVSAQVAFGLPPFYVRMLGQPPDYREKVAKYLAKNMLLIAFSMIALVAESITDNQVKSELFLILGTLLAFLFGLRLRRFLKAEPNLQYPLIVAMRVHLPIIGEITNRYPMLVFDIWTIGMASLLFLLMVFY